MGPASSMSSSVSAEIWASFKLKKKLKVYLPPHIPWHSPRYSQDEDKTTYQQITAHTGGISTLAGKKNITKKEFSSSLEYCNIQLRSSDAEHPLCQECTELQPG